MGWLNHLLEIDKELFLYLNQFYNDYWDIIMVLFTRKETWLPLYLIIVWFFVRNYRSKALMIIFFMILTVVASDQLSGLVKDIFQRLRPVHDPAIEALVHNVLRKGGLYGFVSSHAANSFSIVVFSAYIFKNKGYSFLLLIWALLISYSRIYSGVHFPLDVLGGALLGAAIGYSMFKILMFIENHFFIARPPKIERTVLKASQLQIVFLVLCVMLSVIFISVHLLFKYNYL